jgi:hypothetical protein
MRFSAATLFVGLSAPLWANAQTILNLYDTSTCRGDPYGSIELTNNTCYGPDKLPSGGSASSVIIESLETGCASKLHNEPTPHLKKPQYAENESLVLAFQQPDCSGVEVAALPPVVDVCVASAVVIPGTANFSSFLSGCL